MVEHHLLVVMFGEGIYFAPPASPWLRGTNENTNGLLRQYFRRRPTCAPTPLTISVVSRNASTVGPEGPCRRRLKTEQVPTDEN